MGSLGFYFLLLIAIFAGWLMGRFAYPRKRAIDKDSGDLFEDYFVGLNYLLNDEPDEAIDTFIDALEINSETIETHLALGALLRRRGKVDQAIKVHQALLARPGLEQDFSEATRLQLALDHISAGLLDRAEHLLKEILGEDSNSKWEALHHLVTIYQTEKEWEKAIGSASQLLANPAFEKDFELRVASAHYCCELAELLLDQNQDSKAKVQLKRAFTFDRDNARASFLLARIEQRLGNFKAAIKQLQRIYSSSPDFVGQLLGPLSECYEQMGMMCDFEKLLRSMLSEGSNVNVVLALFDLINKDAGNEAAMGFLNGALAESPSLEGLQKLLGLQVSAVGDDLEKSLISVQKLIDRMLYKNFEYQCNHCGYESRNHYWMCPSCKKWDKIKATINDVAVS